MRRMASHLNMEALQSFLNRQGAGPIADSLQLQSLLEPCWHQFEGCAATEMHSGKLKRIENATWQPPCLELSIERHGAVVRGRSKWANLQTWRLDLDALTAEVDEAGRRLVAPLDKAIDTKAMANSLANAILTGQPNER